MVPLLRADESYSPCAVAVVVVDHNRRLPWPTGRPIDGLAAPPNTLEPDDE